MSPERTDRRSSDSEGLVGMPFMGPLMDPLSPALISVLYSGGCPVSPLGEVCLLFLFKSLDGGGSGEFVLSGG